MHTEPDKMLAYLYGFDSLTAFNIDNTYIGLAGLGLGTAQNQIVLSELSQFTKLVQINVPAPVTALAFSKTASKIAAFCNYTNIFYVWTVSNIDLIASGKYPGAK